MTGRPSSYTEETAAAICQRIAQGESLRAICKDDGMPDQTTVYRWLRDIESFRQHYVRAREDQAELYLDQIIEISDDGSNDTYEDDEGNRKTDWDVIARSKLRVDARKWAMSKLAPKKYGERIAQEISGPDGGPVQMDDKAASARLAQLMALAAARRDDTDSLFEE